MLVRTSFVSAFVENSARAPQTGDFGADIENEERIKALLVLLGQYFLQNRDDFTILGKANPCVTKAIDYISEHI